MEKINKLDQENIKKLKAQNKELKKRNCVKK